MIYNPQEVIGASHVVLLAEPHLDTLCMYLALFEHAGMLAVGTPDPHQALDRARKLAPDVFMSELVFPGVSGADVMRALRSDPATRDTGVIAVTANAVEASRLESGLCDGIFVKPCLPQELVHAVRREAVRCREDRARHGEITGRELADWRAAAFLTMAGDISYVEVRPKPDRRRGPLTVA